MSYEFQPLDFFRAVRELFESLFYLVPTNTRYVYVHNESTTLDCYANPWT